MAGRVQSSACVGGAGLAMVAARSPRPRRPDQIARHGKRASWRPRSPWRILRGQAESVRGLVVHGDAHNPLVAAVGYALRVILSAATEVASFRDPRRQHHHEPPGGYLGDGLVDGGEAGVGAAGSRPGAGVARQLGVCARTTTRDAARRSARSSRASVAHRRRDGGGGGARGGALGGLATARGAWRR